MAARDRLKGELSYLDQIVAEEKAKITQVILECSRKLLKFLKQNTVGSRARGVGGP